MNRQIFEQSEKLLQEKNNNEMLNVIYDTLFQNTQFPQLNIDNVDFQEIDNAKNSIMFEHNGQSYTLFIN